MLKYLYCKEIFREIPGEITLGVSLTGCTIKCNGCHSKELWKDHGTPLTIESVQQLLDKHQGISCLLLFGGEHDIPSLINILRIAHGRVKTAWYCGLDAIPSQYSEILQYLDYVKIGHYDQKLGGLESPTTNQRLYKYSPYYSEYTIGKSWRDITSSFYKPKC